MQPSKTTLSVLEHEWARAEDLEARKAKEEAERKAREEAERKAKEEAERKTREEAERKAKEEAERKTREEAEMKAKEDAARVAPAFVDAKTQQAILDIADKYGQYCGGGFAWKKTATGYACEGGGHSLTFEQLEMGVSDTPYRVASPGWASPGRASPGWD